MNRRLYLLAGTVVLLGALSMGTVAFLQGDFKNLTKQSGKEAPTIVEIELAGDGASAASDAVEVTDGAVTITEGGIYEIRGTAAEVTVSVAKEVSEDVTIRLNNASFASLLLDSKGTNVVELAKESSNNLAGGESGISATNVTLTGDGSLDITEVTNYGIFASDDLVVESGNVTIESAGSGLYSKHESKGKHGNLTLNGGDLTITAGQEEDNVALYASNQMTINKGNLTVPTAYEGYVAKQVTLNGGTSNLNSLAAGIAARDPFVKEGQASDAEISINGGTTTVIAGGNSLVANGDITIAGGVNTLVTTSPASVVLNYTNAANLTGGTLWAFGPTDFSKASQNFLTSNLIGSAGDTITISDGAGNELATFIGPIGFSSVTYTSANLTDGETYFLSTTSGGYGQALATTETAAPSGY